MSQEQKIEQLEKDMVGVKHAILSQNENLKRIEEVLVKVSLTLEQMTVIREKTFANQEEIERLKDIFEDRKEVTDTNNKQFSDFTSRFKGGLVVFLFMFGLIQAMSTFYIRDEAGKAEKLQEKVQTIKEELSVMKDRVERLERQSHQRPHAAAPHSLSH